MNKNNNLLAISVVGALIIFYISLAYLGTTLSVPSKEDLKIVDRWQVTTIAGASGQVEIGTWVCAAFDYLEDTRTLILVDENGNIIQRIKLGIDDRLIIDRLPDQVEQKDIEPLELLPEPPKSDMPSAAALLYGLFLVRSNKSNKRSTFLGLVKNRNFWNHFPDEYRFNAKYNPKLLKNCHTNELPIKRDLDYHPIVGFYLNMVPIEALDYIQNTQEKIQNLKLTKHKTRKPR